MSLRSRTSYFANWKLRRWLPSTLAIGLGLGAPATWVLAQQPPVAPAPSVPGAKPDDKKPADPKVEAKKPEDPKKDPLATQRTISVSWDGAQWQEVLDWYAKESGMILNTSVRPTGSVTIKPPGANRKFTLGEVTDLLNEAMVLQKFILIRYNTTFTIWPVDEKIDWTLIPAITQDELPSRGKTELVRCVIGPFRSVSALEIRPEIEAMLTPFGKVQLLERANSFQVSDKAGNIHRIKKVLDDIENTSDGGHFRYECKYKKAREIAGYLKDLLKDSSTTVESPMVMQYQPYGGYSSGYGQPWFGQPGGGMDFRRDRDRGSSGSSGQSSYQPRGAKTVQIAVDDDKNALLVTAPEDKIVQAKKIVEESDVPSFPGQKPIVVTPPVLKTYSVPAGTADATAKAITERYPWIRVTAIVASNQIMVVASADDHSRVSEVLTGGVPVGTDGGTITKVIPVSGDPKELSVTVAKPFPSSTTGGPLIEPQAGGILFRGTPEQLKQIEDILKAIEGPTSGVTGNRLQFTLDGGNAGILAEALGNAMKGMGKNPVIVRNLYGSPGVPQRSNPQPGPTPAPGIGLPAMPPPAPLPGEKKSSLTPPPAAMNKAELPHGPRDPRFVLAQLVDPEAKKDLKPVIISVVGNKITVESEDTSALQLINDMIRLYMQNGSKPDDNLMEVIKLKYVGAEDAAKVVSEVFNGPQPTNQSRGGGGGGGFNPINLIGGLLGGGGAPSGPPAPGRVRVVAEKSSNSLIVVRSSPLDLLTMKKLLANVIDSGETDSDAVQRTYVIRLKNTDAVDMASQLEKLYRPLLSASGGAQASPFPFPFAQPQGGGSTAKPPALTISTDDRTNSVLIMATKTLYEEVRGVVEMLDTAVAADSTEVVRVVPIRGIDPGLVQQMVDAMQGRDPNAATTRGGLGTQGGFGQNRTGQQGTLGGFPGLGGGGFPGLGTFGGFGGGGNRGGGIGAPGAGGGGNRGGGGGTRGGGGGTRGGGGRQANLGSQEGPSNFDDRDMDVPSALTSSLYDPETDRSAPAPAIHTSNPRRKVPDIFQTGFQQPVPIPGVAQPAPGAQPNTAIRPVDGQPGVGVSAPTGTVTAIPLSEAGVVVLRTTNPRDMEIVLELMDFIRKQAEGTEPELRLVPLKHQDCNVVAGTLNSIFARVQVGVGSNTVPAAARQVNTGNILSALGGAPSSTQNVYCVAMPRFNALLIAGPKGRFADIIKEVEKQDQPNDPSVQVKAIQLKKASAQVIALQLRQLYSQRFPSEGPPSMQFRINFDLPSNSILVTAAPADMKDIEELIKQLDTMTSQALNDLRIFALKNAYADELASVLIQALTSNVVNPLQQAQQQWYTQSVTQGNVGALGGIQALLGQGQQGQLGQQQLGQQLGQLGQLGQFGQQFGGAGQNQLGTGGVNLSPTIAQVGSSTGGGLATKSSALRFFSARDGQVVETGFLEDVHIIPNTRTNALLVAAKPETMKLIEKLIDNLDTVAAARSYINIFQMKKADAALTALMIQQLFSGSNRTTLTPGGGAQGQGLNQGAQGANQTAARPLLTVFGDVSPGASLIDLRISIDDRTNSLIVAGSLNDLETIRSIIAQLELADTQQRHFDVYKLRNAAAADVASSLQTFMTNSLNVYTGAQFNSAYLQLQRNVVIVAEPVSNTIMVSATPQYFAELKRIIERIDAQPPQVVIQVMIAEVQLSNNEEIGVEYGVQSPVLFNRGGSLNFNTTSALASSNVSPGIVGYQGIGNLGVGRTSSTGGAGGFVFAAQSDSFNLLVRALKAQGRIDILSRPQLHVTDNQTGYINVGQRYPTPSTQVVTNGISQQGVEYVDIGITMRVTPRINPDGKVLMRVEPQVSNVATSTVSVAPGVNAPIFNQETVETTVLAADGETIVIGGLINKTDSRNETGIPFLKDIPYAGALFRYRTQSTQRREVLFIMTPHIVRTEYDTARILAEESRRINMCLPEIGRIHGHGMDVMGPASQGANPIPVGGTIPGQIPVGQLPGGFGPGFVPAPVLPGPGSEGGLEIQQPIGAANPTMPPLAAPAGPRATPFMPMIPPAGGIPILNQNGTITPAGATVHPGATPYIMPAGGTPPVIAMPSGAMTVTPTRNGSTIMAYPPAQDVPAGTSKAPRGKEDRPWGVFSK